MTHPPHKDLLNPATLLPPDPGGAQLAAGDDPAAVAAARGLVGESGPVVAVTHCTARGAALSDASSERGCRWTARWG